MGITQSRTEIMECLTDSTFEEVKLEVEAMTQEKAQELHELIKENWRTVCYLSGKGGIRRAKWTSLLRKMGLIENKSKEVPK